MKRFALLLALAATACTGGGRDFASGPPLKPSANPSAVIAAELAFSQLAQDKGQWTAFRTTAAPGAEMFAPLRVMAAVWLKGRTDPPVPVQWQPDAVWSSCDGSYAITRGGWQRPGATGYYLTVWQRQKDGTHKWLLDQSIASEAPLEKTEMIEAKVADCSPVKQPVKLLRSDPATDISTGQSDDHSLVWTTSVDRASGARNFSVMLWQEGEMHDVEIVESDAGVAGR